LQYNLQSFQLQCQLDYIADPQIKPGTGRIK